MSHLVSTNAARTAAACSCSWRADDPSPAGLGVAVLAHLGIPLSPPRRPRRCHDLCYDDDGHTDGCIYDEGCVIDGGGRP